MSLLRGFSGFVLAGVLAVAQAPAAFSASTDFYVTVVRSIEGLDTKVQQLSRPLVDDEAVKYVPPELHAALVEHLVGKTSQLFGSQVIHPGQVGDVLKGTPKFVDCGKESCEQAGQAPVAQTYFVVLGVSRASKYKVPRDGRVELLLPFTLNLQVIRPDRGRIVYSSSRTVYTPFLFSEREADSTEATKKISELVGVSLKETIDALVVELAGNFKPISTKVQIVARDGDLLVANKGFEVGFAEPRPGALEIALDSAGKEVAFQVVSVDEGYSVLRSLGGVIKEGEEFQFLFDSKSDDSRKPRLMAVSSLAPARAEINGVMENFTKNIGFKAPFQIVAVDPNYARNMLRIQEQARNVNWSNFPAAKQEKDSRTDWPQFFLAASLGETSVSKQASQRDIKSRETFGTVVGMYIFDASGNVIGSAIGSDTYLLEKTGGQGLALQNAREISFRNAVKAATADFLANVKLDIRRFPVKGVEKGLIITEGMSVGDGAVIEGVLYRSLKPKISGREVVVKLPARVKGSVARSGESQAIPFETGDILEKSLAPKTGDFLVVYSLPKANAVPVKICAEEYIGKGNSVKSRFSKPFAAHALLSAPNLQVKFMPLEVREDIDELLDAAYFKKIAWAESRESSDKCMQLGYLIREEKRDCSGGACKAEVSTALAIRSIEGDSSKKDFIAARKLQLSGFGESDTEGSYSLTAFQQHEAMMKDLLKQLSSFR